MARYFFDFRSSGSSSIDEEGESLADIGAAHELAVKALADAICELAFEGGKENFAIEVRDELGPVLHVTAVLQSRIFRTQ